MKLIKKMIMLLFIVTLSLISNAQVHSGGVTLGTGFKIQNPTPIDDRTVVADSLSLLTIPNQYAGLVSYSVADKSLFIKTNTNWKKVTSGELAEGIDEVLAVGHIADGKELILADTAMGNDVLTLGSDFLQLWGASDRKVDVSTSDIGITGDAGKVTYSQLGVSTTAKAYILEGTQLNFPGITYAEDYSTNYSLRSLVDKEYVANSISDIQSVSGVVKGIVNNIELQELGGTDKLINGVRIGRGNSNKSGNTVLGAGGLNANTTGDNNSIFGAGSGASITTGANNTSIGAYSLYYETQGSNNVAIGAASMSGSSASTRNRNIAIGTNSANSLTTGDDNVLIGADIPLAQNRGLQSGSGNTIIGKLDNKLRTGSNNTILGRFEYPSNVTNVSNNIFIANGSGTMGYSMDGVTNRSTIPNQTVANISSDETGKAIVIKEYTDVKTRTGINSYIIFNENTTLLMYTLDLTDIVMNIPNPATHTGKTVIIKAKGDSDLVVVDVGVSGLLPNVFDLNTSGLADRIEVPGGNSVMLISDGTVWQVLANY